MIERRESRPDVIVIGCEKLQPKFFNLWFYQVLIFSFQIRSTNCTFHTACLWVSCYSWQLCWCSFFQPAQNLNVDTYIATQDSKFWSICWEKKDHEICQNHPQAQIQAGSCWLFWTTVQYEHLLETLFMQVWCRWWWSGAGGGGVWGRRETSAAVSTQ